MLTSTEGTVMADQANRQLYHCSAARSNAVAAQHVTPMPLRVIDSSVGRQGAALVPLAYRGAQRGGWRGRIEQQCRQALAYNYLPPTITQAIDY